MMRPENDLMRKFWKHWSGCHLNPSVYRNLPGKVRRCKINTYLNAVNLSFNAQHIGHISGASSSRIYPHTSQTWIGPKSTSFPKLIDFNAFS